jgi:hypothetical protein
MNLTRQESSASDLIAELRGFAEGSTSARATLMRDAANAIEQSVSSVDAAYREGFSAGFYSGRRHPHIAAATHSPDFRASAPRHCSTGEELR